ncbi:hypothetical protein A0U91_15705 (plasmid) [Acetobacter persici]|uniref:Uncharacterized protein n=2 Tax=Acetobacter persici TaxID=1076596 RepID=A0A1U9LJ92_9PROT|nr:hypothetical protein A0U91_15705 [Acetobacter persici]
MARTGWHDGLSISKDFFTRAGAEGVTLDKCALILGLDNEDPQKMRRLALWRSLADNGVTFDIPEMVARRMQEYVESPVPDHTAERRMDPQSALFAVFVEACMEREMDLAEMRIAAGLPDPARFRRWMKQASESVPLRIPEETRVAMSEWIVAKHIHAPEDVLVRKEMVGMHEMLAATGSVPKVQPVAVPVPDIAPGPMPSDAPDLSSSDLQASSYISDNPSLEAEEVTPSPIFLTAAELHEPPSPDEGSQFQLSLGF